MMKKILTVLCGLLSLQFVTAQNPVIPGNMINNCGFENYTTPLPSNGGSITPATGWFNGCAQTDIQGNLGTPDLITNNPAVGVFAKIPLMQRIGARNNGLTNNAFAAIGGLKPTAAHPELRGESILAAITENLTADYQYTVSLWTAAWALPTSYGYPDPEFQVEIVLRKPNNCTAGKVVFTSGNVPIQNRGDVGQVSSNWSNITGTFVLDATDVAQGYSLIEIRFNNATGASRVGIDDVSLTKQLLAKAAFSFVTLGQTYTTINSLYGPQALTQVCAAPAPAETQVLINGSASTNEQNHYVSVGEFDPMTWTYVNTANPTMFSNWLGGPAPLTDINLSNLPGVTFLPGKVYFIGFAVGSPWNSTGQLFRINALPTIDVPATATICSGSSASVVVNSNTWPVKVYRGSTLVGTYSSSPISLAPTTNTTYTFTTTTPYNCYASDQIAITVNNCPRASFVFKDPFGIENEGPTQYGPVPVTKMCVPDVIIDGTASANETSYWVDVEEMNITNWTMGPYLYSGWTSGQITGDINLRTLIRQNNPSFNFQVGQIYNVGIAVAPGGNSMNKLFRVVNCTKSLGTELEEITSEEPRGSVLIFPNPTNGSFRVTLDDVTAQKVVIMNVLGEEVFNSEVSDKTSSLLIDLSNQPTGVYMLHVQQRNGETILEKIIKN